MSAVITVAEPLVRVPAEDKKRPQEQKREEKECQQLSQQQSHWFTYILGVKRGRRSERESRESVSSHYSSCATGSHTP